jgi:SprT-like protein
MLKVTVLELYEIAEKFLYEHFNMSLGIPIRVSPQLKSTYGYFRHGRLDSVEIKLSKQMLENQSRAVSIDVLKHELVHYALFEKRLPYKDGQDHFENTLKDLGVASTRTYKYVGELHHYRCKKGCQSFKKRRRGYEKPRYCCRKCGTRGFEYLGKVKVG